MKRNGPIPGPRSLALIERERRLLAPGTQQVSQLAGIALDGGEGAMCRDVDGNWYLDFFAGMAVASLGHGHPALASALARQATQVTAGSFTTEARVAFLERVVAATSGVDVRLRRTQLYSGGAEAVESALRLARAYTGRTEVVAFDGAFHGKTGGVLGLMGSSWKDGLGPFLPGQHLAPYPDPFRHPELTVEVALEALERLISERAGKVAAILVEPMQGTAGNVIPPDRFLPAVADLARRQGALVIVDEMITGWGRTGRRFASEHSGVQPDILCFGKGVAGGFPLSGIVTTDEICVAEPWSRPSFSSSSYGGGPLACAAGAAVAGVILDEDLSGHADRVGRVLLAALHRELGGLPVVGEIRGRGLLLAVELVSNGQPLGKDACLGLFHACLQRGLLTTAYSARLRINPPLVLTEAQAEEGATILGAAVREVCA